MEQLTKSRDYVCKVRAAGKTDPPQDCDWPNCGCDEKAQEVLEHLQECGYLKDEPRINLIILLPNLRYPILFQCDPKVPVKHLITILNIRYGQVNEKFGRLMECDRQYVLQQDLSLIAQDITNGKCLEYFEVGGEV